ncbi:hypothetical protein MRX96_042864 [Rhipicephalus microplus]
MEDFIPRDAQDFNKDTIVLAYWADEDGHWRELLSSHGHCSSSLTTATRKSRQETVAGVPPNEEKLRAHEDKIKDMENEIGNLKEEAEKINEKNCQLAELLEQERERSRRLTDALLNKFEPLEDSEGFGGLLHGAATSRRLITSFNIITFQDHLPAAVAAYPL